MAFFDWISKLIPQILGNQTLIYSLIGLLILVGYFFLRKGEVKTNMKLHYFAEVERLVTPLDIKELTPKSVLTKDDKKFMRRAKSWLYKDGVKTFVLFLGKVGRGLTYTLEQNKEEGGKDVVEKIGSLWDGIVNCLQVNEGDEITKSSIDDEAIKKLKQSDIFVCVDLERDTEDMPKITEESAVKEADRNMMDLVGMKIKQQLQKEDWIKNGGLMAMGALAYILAMQLGLL